jgi:hypothetical protein
MDLHGKRLILGSGSPRRRELLAKMRNVVVNGYLPRQRRFARFMVVYINTNEKFVFQQWRLSVSRLAQIKP